MKKSQLVGFLLTLVFGPLGLFYSNVVIALVFTLAAGTLVLLVTILTFGVGLIFILPIIWAISIIASYFSVREYNSKMGQ